MNEIISINTIKITAENMELSNGNKRIFLAIYVDGKSLIEIIKERELKILNEEQKQQAGKYSFLYNMLSLKDNLIYLLGKNTKKNYFGKKFRLLECNCGCLGCSPILCSIKLNRKLVIWSNFENEQRNGKHGKLLWNYGKEFGFKFKIEQYMEAINEYNKEVEIHLTTAST